MSVRTLYFLVGIAWGVLLGFLVWVFILGFAVAPLGHWLVEDRGWGSWTDEVVLGTAAAAALAILVISILFALRHARLHGSRQIRRLRRRGYVLLVVAVALSGVFFAGGGVWLGREASERARRSLRQAAFERLRAARHRFAGIAIGERGNDSRAVTLSLRGQRPGAYRLDWSIRQRTHDRLLSRGQTTLDLPVGSAQHAFTVDLRRLRDAYQEENLNGGSDVLVQEALYLYLSLQPILTETEQARIPAAELRDLSLGESSLVADERIGFLVEFRF